MSRKTFTNLLNEGLDLYHADKFQEGYDLMTSNASHEPRNDAQIFDFRASLACRTGRPELALELLTEAVMEKGCWYTQEYLDGDDDIAPAARLPGFDRLRTVCAERERQARAASSSDLAMVRSSRGEDRAPLIIALHGNMQNIPICQEDWRGTAEQGFDLAFVRSSSLAFHDAYVWNDLQAGAADLGKQLAVLRSAGELDGRPVVMAGFSAGARLALHAVMIGAVAPDAMVLVGPWLPEIDQWSAKIEKLGDRMPGAYICCGDRDADCLPGAKLLADTLDLADRPCRLVIPPGIGHDYPSGFAESLREAVISLIDNSKRLTGRTAK